MLLTPIIHVSLVRFFSACFEYSHFIRLSWEKMSFLLWHFLLAYNSSFASTETNLIKFNPQQRRSKETNKENMYMYTAQHIFHTTKTCCVFVCVRVREKRLPFTLMHTDRTTNSANIQINQSKRREQRKVKKRKTSSIHTYASYSKRQAKYSLAHST